MIYKIYKSCIILFAFLFLLSCQNLIKSLPKESFFWPLKNSSLSQKFSPRSNILHQGIDLLAKKGTPVYSSQKGLIIYAGNNLSGYGNVIIIEHSKNWSTLYAHLDKIFVKDGVFVKEKQKIGVVGNTGRSNRSHLHFELMYKKQSVNPLLYLSN